MQTQNQNQTKGAIAPPPAKGGGVFYVRQTGGDFLYYAKWGGISPRVEDAYVFQTAAAADAFLTEKILPLLGKHNQRWAVAEGGIE